MDLYNQTRLSVSSSGMTLHHVLLHFSKSWLQKSAHEAKYWALWGNIQTAITARQHSAVFNEPTVEVCMMREFMWVP